MSDETFQEANQSNSQMARRFIKIGLGVLALVLLLVVLFNSFLIVKEGEYKVIRQFGEVVRVEDDPGLKFKIPLLQTVTTLSNKRMVYDVTEKEINSLDKKRMIIDNYSVWEITDPVQMINNARTVVNAETRMGEFIFSVVRSELGQMNRSEIINEEESSRGHLNEQVTKRVNELLERDQYGIRVVDVRIKRTDLPDENEAAVYNRMISERESKAQEYLSQGDADKKRITAETDKNVKEMLAKANKEASEIRAEGEREAAQIYNDAFSKDADFYQLYRTLDSYKKTINEETTIILPQDSPYAEMLTGYFN
ncbi:tail fiber protein [Pontibacillus halophilus JSM 076056 = DSM 19796]|uniref:Protein HflC n=1 Tax=Pontibacillus halophilus JSM 076056 = DSM 19796 TaxID=1385510 RepID=A0A0A5GN22_9BACI|nr:protease modulator HflC [Pontibacillus halophilus]KGX93389.1 tail fiber protein [Pontibacillus halophilus JSM 076056 = DSM 19796]